MMDDALVRARYAVSMLRLAHEVGLPHARRMIDALAAETVVLNTNYLIIESEARAIAAFRRLAETVQLGLIPDKLWQQAIDAASSWENSALYQAHIVDERDNLSADGGLNLRHAPVLSLVSSTQAVKSYLVIQGPDSEARNMYPGRRNTERWDRD